MWNWTDILRGSLVILVAVLLVVWFVIRTVRGAEDPMRRLFHWILTLPTVILMFAAIPMFGVVGPFVIVFCGVVLSILWTPSIATWAVRPITGLFDGGSEPPEPKPAYSAAVARAKQGKYLEAIVEIRAQLDRFPTDFEGHFLLARIQAEDLKDLPGAEATIAHLCSQPGHPPGQVVSAWFAIADWHLRINRDVDSARAALERIQALYPDSEYSNAAAQRLAHLGTKEDLEATVEPRRFAVPEGIRDLGLRKARAEMVAPGKTPEQQAAEYVNHLIEHPLDTEAREQLALIYANHYQRVDLATAELEQLIATPHQPHRLVVHWLNTLADVQVRCGAAYETVKETLERIISLDPGLAAADQARRRIDLLKLEMKAKGESTAVKLGVYEQNLGLKGRLPRQL